MNFVLRDLKVVFGFLFAQGNVQKRKEKEMFAKYKQVFYL